MATISGRDADELRTLLQDAVVKCSERCLYQSAKWAAEFLTSLPPIDTAISPTDTEADSPTVDASHFAIPTVTSRNENHREARLEALEYHKYLLAKTLFDCREYDRCAAVFLPVTLPRGELSEDIKDTNSSSKKGKGPAVTSEDRARELHDSLDQTAAAARGFPELSQKALFLALYAKFMAGEKRKEEEREVILGPADSGLPSNRELLGIAHVLEARLGHQNERGEQGQGWLEYLYGVAVSKLRSADDAKLWFIRSIRLYPYNWAPWQELCQLLGSAEEYENLRNSQQLPQNIINYIFHIYASQELFNVADSIFSTLKQAKRIFPGSSFLRTQKALLHYHSKDFDHAERTFSKLLATDPLRLDSLDAYSNILYVMEKRPKLAFLAQLASATDKFRPETCCIVGNYYAMKSEHEKAVVYFRRALTLDPSFLSAWTLMGHEFVEMKNTQAAIECYRRAVDVQRKDYRAWYGLGQTYEMLDMGYYALFYYQRAAALAPLDPKMWSAVGTCLSKMNRPAQAVKAFKRALAAGSYYESGGTAGSAVNSFGSGRSTGSTTLMDPDILYSIAEMYDKMRNDTERKAYLELALAQEEGPAPASQDEATDFARSITSNPEPQQSTMQGVGVTQTTSRARLWLAKIEMAEAAQLAGRDGEDAHESARAVEKLRRAMELANQLCQDGYEVEEAKGLVREIRSRLEKP